MLIAAVLISLLYPIHSINTVCDSSACATIEGHWEVFDGFWGDSNVIYNSIGILIITGFGYQFVPEEEAFISPEMRQRFGFIQETEGSLLFEYREEVPNTGSNETDVILGTISFNGGEGFLVRTDIENGILCLTSAVSEFELFRIFKPLPR